MANVIGLCLWLLSSLSYLFTALIEPQNKFILRRILRCNYELGQQATIYKTIPQSNTASRSNQINYNEIQESLLSCVSILLGLSFQKTCSGKMTTLTLNQFQRKSQIHTIQRVNGIYKVPKHD